MLACHRAQVALRRIASPQARERHRQADCSSLSLRAAAHFLPTESAPAGRDSAAQRRASCRPLHFCPIAHISGAPRPAVRQGDTTVPVQAGAAFQQHAVSEPRATASARTPPTAVNGLARQPTAAPTPAATASSAAAAPTIDSSAPIVYQDMGRNKPKLYFYASQHTAADPLSFSPSASLVAGPSPSHLPQQDAHTDKQLVLHHFFASPLARRLLNPFAGLLQHLLPKGYPNSVSAPYTPYSQYTFVQSFASTASGVLSMQSLLFAVGLGQPLAVPAAAAIQWVMKDGLGQLGGMLFASYVNARFDSDAKRWRMLAACMQDGSVVVEMCTPLVPALFLPLASAANIGKNVAWLSASASRACIHRSFCREENLADITAKANSQTIAASLVGTALGIGLSYAVGPDVLQLLGVFAVLSCLHLGSTYVSLCRVPLNTINDQRGERAMLTYCHDKRVPSTDEVRESERFVSPYRSPLNSSRLDMKAQLPAVVADFEAMLPHLSPPAPPAEWNGLSSLDRLLLFYADDGFLLTIRPSENEAPLRYTVSLLFLSSATSADVLSAYLLQVRLRWAVEQLLEGAARSADEHFQEVCPLLQQSVRWVREHRSEFIQQLEAQDWNVEHLFLESDKQRRVEVLQTRVRAVKGSTVRQKTEE